MNERRRDSLIQPPENGPKADSDIVEKPQTWAQYLREGAVNMTRDFRGVFLRLLSYTTGSTTVSVGMHVGGVSEETATYTAFGLLVVTMLAGESYVFPRLQARLPWFRVSIWDRRK